MTQHEVGDDGHPGAEDPAQLEAERSETDRLILTRAQLRRDATPIPLRRQPTKMNLPHQPTTIVGRAREIGQLAYLLNHNDTRMVTIIGPGGVGKTRLACEVAELVAESFDVVVFVDLGPARSVDDVLAFIAESLGVTGAAPQSAIGRIRSALDGNRTLVVLDNCEHVTRAAASLAELLSECPGLYLLVTSRIALRLRWEQLYPLATLPTPDPMSLPPLERLASIPSVELLLARIRSIRPDFELTDQNAGVVASICARLEGLPLALELAATQTRTLTLSNLLRRLDHRLDVLVSGAVDLPSRQQSLRATLDSSYDLLEPRDQAFARQIAIFEGDASLAAIETLTAELQTDTVSALERISTLAEHQLVQLRTDASDDMHVTMLDTIREYLLARLEATDELPAVQQRYIDYYLSLVAETPMQSASEIDDAFDVFERELPNIKNILHWTIKQRRPDIGLRFASCLWNFWSNRNLGAEGQQWFSDLIRIWKEDCTDTIPAPILAAAGFLSTRQGDMRQAESLLTAAIDTWGTEPADDLMRTHIELAYVHLCRGACDRAAQRLEMVRSAVDTADNLTSRAYFKFVEFLIAAEQGDLEDPTNLLLECRELATSIQDDGLLGVLACQFGDMALNSGEYETAYEQFQLALATVLVPRRTTIESRALVGLGDTALMRHRFLEAAEYYLQALRLIPQHHSHQELLHLCESVCCYLALKNGGAYGPAEAWQIVMSVRQATGIVTCARRREWIAQHVPSARFERHEPWQDVAPRSIDESHICSMIGQMLVTRDTVPVETGSRGVHTPTISPHLGLSPREREVVSLITQGRTNRQIAVSLSIGERTVDSHVGNILRKLGLKSRAQIAAWAVRQSIVTSEDDPQIIGLHPDTQ